MSFAHAEKLRELEEFAFLTFPDEPWLQIRNLEDSDAQRVCHYCSHRFRHVYQSGVMLHDEAGFWHLLDGSDTVQSIVRSLIVSARNRAAEDVSERPGIDVQDRWEFSRHLSEFCELKSMHVINVARQLSQIISAGGERNLSFESVSPESFDNRDKYPVIPVSFSQGVSFGGSIDLRTAKYLSPVDTGVLMMRYHGWGMPLFDKDIFVKDSPGKQAMEDAIKNRWTEDLITRFARHLLGTSKNVDVVTAPTNWGKSTLITAMERALPGMIGRLEAYKAFSRQGDRFSQTSIMLSEKLLVFVDEAGQDDPERSAEISPGALNTFTDDLLQVEKKFKDNRAIPRLGTAILIGHTWAAVNASAQGIATRIRWAFRASEGPQMTSAERDLLLSDDGIDYLRAWIMRRCTDLWQSSDDGLLLDDLTMSADNRQSLAEFEMSRSDPLALVLTEEFEVGSPSDYVPSSEIKAAMEEAHGEKIGDKALGAKMKIAFHATHIRAGRTTDPLTRKQIRVWFGLKNI